MRPALLIGLLLTHPALAQDQPNIPPANYRPGLSAVFRANLKDPASIQNPMISKPFLAWMGVAKRYVVCIRISAKNSFGARTSQEFMATYVGGRLLGVTEPYLEQCREARYGPFTEMAK